MFSNVFLYIAKEGFGGSLRKKYIVPWDTTDPTYKLFEIWAVEWFLCFEQKPKTQLCELNSLDNRQQFVSQQAILEHDHIQVPVVLLEISPLSWLLANIENTIERLMISIGVILCGELLVKLQFTEQLWQSTHTRSYPQIDITVPMSSSCKCHVTKLRKQVSPTSCIRGKATIWGSALRKRKESVWTFPL